MHATASRSRYRTLLAGLTLVAWTASASAIDTVTLTVDPSSTWELTLGILDGTATDTDTSSVAGTITVRLDDATNPTAMAFDGTNSRVSTPDDFAFEISLGFLGGLDAEVLNAAGPIFTPRPGEGNGDGLITGADYTIWADNFDGGAGEGGKTFMQGDWNADGFVTGADYTLWADNFGLLTTPVSGGQFDLSQHLGLINEGSAPYQGSGLLSGESGEFNFETDPVAIQSESGQFGTLTSTPTGNPNEYLITLTIPWNISTTLDEDNGVTLDTSTMITATGLFTNTSLVPEPGALALLGLGGLGLIGWRRSRG